MTVVDSHVHLYPPEANRDPAGWAQAQREAHWATLCTRRRRDGRPVQGFSDVEGLLRAMDAAGVGRAVLLGWYWENFETCRRQNRFYAECVRRHPDRLAACATLHPAAGRDATLAEIRQAKEEGLVGLGELSPHSQRFSVDDPVFREVLALAADLKWPVNLHVTDPASRDFPGRVETPLADFARVARACPRTTFILAHWGGLLPLNDSGVGKLPNVYVDTAASPLLYGPEIWARFAGAVGAGRVLFGSDFPLNLYPKLELEAELVRLVAEAKASGLSAEDLSAIFSGNARRLFFL
ncbi:MAG TPA: amidohydrolase family protein [Opitutaceae bacterium]|nr:amidohydrolase family protein [Opitutaceae bacterium]